MNHDLDAALQDLAGQAAAAHRARRTSGTGVSTRDVTRRVRRHRRVRAGLTTTAALVAVTGVVLAGAALADRPEPQPAQSPSPTVTAPAPTTPAPTPSITTPAVTLPTGDASLPFGACGSLMTAAAPGGIDTHYGLSLSVPDPALRAGERLQVETTRARRDSDVQFVGAVESAGARLAVSLDGVVVATTTVGDEEMYLDLGIEGGELTGVLDHLPLTTCAPESAPGVLPGIPLPAGTYEVQAWSRVVYLADDAQAFMDSDQLARPVADLVAEHGPVATIVAAPVAIRIDGHAEAVEPDPGADTVLTLPEYIDWPVCGGPAPIPGPPGSFRLTTSAPGTVVGADGLDAVQVTFGYDGPGQARIVSRGAGFAWAVQDGVVVGTSFLGIDGSMRQFLGHGLPTTSGIMYPWRCDSLTTADGDLPPGEYQVYTGAFFSVDSVHTSSGTQEGDPASTFVFADPFTLVVP